VEVKQRVAPEVAEEIDELEDLSQSPIGASIAAAVSSSADSGEPTATEEAPRIEAKGLGPSRPEHMEYSAPDEAGGVIHGEMESEEDGIVEVDPNAPRAERRRAERSNRKSKNASKKKKRR